MAVGAQDRDINPSRHSTKVSETNWVKAFDINISDTVVDRLDTVVDGVYTMVNKMDTVVDRMDTVVDKLDTVVDKSGVTFIYTEIRPGRENLVEYSFQRRNEDNGDRKAREVLPGKYYQ